MKAIVNGRVLLPDGMATGKALLYDERIHGLADEREPLRGRDEIPVVAALVAQFRHDFG